MNNIILSICIPTYNRAKQLSDCLENIIFQLKESNLSNQVEIIVSDNCSDDDTTSIVKKIQEKFTNITYSRNNKNLYFDRNVFNTLQLARGQYCWTLNDDTLLKTEAIKYILGILKNNSDVAFFCVNQNDFSSINEGQKFNNGNEWLKTMGLTGGRLSQCIFKKENLPRDIEKYFDNLWVHFSIALEIMKDRPAFYVKNLFEPADKNRLCRWAVGGSNLTTYIELKKIIENLLQFGYHKDIVENILKDMAKGLPKLLASAKLWGLKITFSKISLLFKQFYKYPFYLFLSLIVLFVPTFFLRFIKAIKK